MSDQKSAEAIESIVRPIETRPKSEIAPAIESMEFGNDMHDDPDAPNAPPTEAEAAEAVASWRVAKSLLRLRKQINELAPTRQTASDGTIGDSAHCNTPGRVSDHCPSVRDAGIGIVTAMDITHDPQRGCDASKIAHAIHASRDPSIKYIIWNRKIANASEVNGNPAWTWRDYTGSNPHNKHVHLSVKSTKERYDSEEAWSVSASESGPLDS